MDIKMKIHLVIIAIMATVLGLAITINPDISKGSIYQSFMLILLYSVLIGIKTNNDSGTDDTDDEIKVWEIEYPSFKMKPKENDTW